MSTTLTIFLGAITGIIIFLTFIIIYIKLKLRKTLGQDYKEVKGMIKQGLKESVNAEKNNYTKEKTIGGITNIIEPRILEDFPSFNKDILFAKAKNDITSILNAYTNKNLFEIDKNKEITLVNHYIKDKIMELNREELEEKFNDIEVTKTVIKGYKKYGGAATIQLSSEVKYYYDTNKPNEKHYDDVKKSTRIDTEYVYVYNPEQFNSQTHFALHCPNCGAPIQDLSSNCTYCGIHLNHIDLKAWKIDKIDIK